MREADDLFMRDQIQITDEELDPMRRRASVHRGAAYMQEFSYPPHGASSGQEGGRMKPGQIIEVFGALRDEEELGESYCCGLDVLGAQTKKSFNEQLKDIKTKVTKDVRAAGGSKTVADVAGKVAAAKAGTTPRGAITMKTSVGGRKYLALKLLPKNDPKVTIKNAEDAYKRLKAAAKKVEELAKKRAAAPKPIGKTKVKGEEVQLFGVLVDDDVEIFGVAQSTLKNIAKGRKAPKLSARRLKKLADQLNASAKKFEKKKESFKGVVKSNEAAKKAGLTKSADNMYKGVYVTGTSFRGLDDDDLTIGDMIEIDGVAYDVCDVLGAYADVCAEDFLGKDIPSDFLAPADDSEPPPSTDPGSDTASDPLSEGAANNYGLPPAPTKASPLSKPEDYISEDGYGGPSTPYSSDPSIPGTTPVPPGAIYWDANIKPMPYRGVGSYTRFYGGAADATEYRNAARGREGGWGNSGFQLGGGNPSIMDGWYWWWNGAISGTQYKKDEPGGGTGINYRRSLPERQDISLKFGWGPLIGNPDIDWTKGLRFDPGYVASPGAQPGGWFWFYDAAPDFARGPVDAARFMKELQDYNNDLAAAKADAAAQLIADQQEAKEAADQLKQDAKDDARTQRQFELEQKKAEHDAAIKAIEDERQAKLAEAESERGISEQERLAKLDEERELRMMQAAEEMDLRRAQAEEDRLMRFAELADREAAAEAETPEGESPEMAEAVDEGELLVEEEAAPSEEPAQESTEE